MSQDDHENRPGGEDGPGGPGGEGGEDGAGDDKRRRRRSGPVTKGGDARAAKQFHTRVKTARGRKYSSKLWLERQLNDPYVARAKQDGYRSRIKPGDADYFRLSRRDEAEARAAPERPAPSVRQARRLPQPT